MSFRPLNTQNSQGQNYGQINDMVRQINKEQTTKVFKGSNGRNGLVTGRLPNNLGYGIELIDPDNVPRIIIYIDENGEPVLKVSDDGYDVTTATDDQLRLNSSQNVFKIVRKYTLTVDPTANSPGTYGSYTASEAHGLGSPRVIDGFVDSSLGGRTNLPHSEMVVTGAPGSQVMQPGTYKWIEVDGTNITAHVETTTLQAAVYTFTVYLQQETAS